MVKLTDSCAYRSLCSKIVFLSLSSCTSSARILKFSVKVLVSSSYSKSLNGMIHEG